MIFRIRITANDKFAIDFNEENLGTEGLEWLRDQIEVPVPHVCVDYCLPEYRTEITWMEISETRARKSGRFKCSTYVTVVVPHKFLNTYVQKNVVVEKNTSTGEIVRAAINRRIDVDAVLHGWEEAGYPIEWGFDEEAEEIRIQITEDDTNEI